MRLHKYFALILIVFSFIIGSCASHVAVHPEPINIQSVIEPGDTVRIVTKDNQETEFVVTEVTDEYIIGENIKVPLKDIKGIEEETVSAGLKFLVITILIVGAAALTYHELSTSPLAEGAYGMSPEGNAAFSVFEEATNRSKGRSSYFSYHPGDWHAFEHGGIDEKCRLAFSTEECDARFNCKYERNIENSRRRYFKGMKSCSARLQACKDELKQKQFECIQKEHPIGFIAVYLEGGYYSDGSYYEPGESNCVYGYGTFKNIHPTKDKYEKTKWQKDRDECMSLTFENVKCTFWNTRRSGKSPKSFFSLSKKYYRECLNERGY